MSINRISKRETTGNENNVAQSFYQNIFVDKSNNAVLPFSFDVPQYTTIGGTKEYYGQDPLAIFTNLVLPFIRFDFSENTASFGPDVQIKHDFYRVNWNTFSAYQDKVQPDKEDVEEFEDITKETIEEIDEVTGERKIRTITKTKSSNKSMLKYSKDWKGRNVESQRGLNSGRIASDNVEQSDAESAISNELSTIQNDMNVERINQQGIQQSPIENVQNQLWNTIQKQLLEPVFSITVETTDITTNIYDLQLDQFTKNLGEYETELFKDKDQYIIDTNFVFKREVTPGLTDYKEVTNVDGGGISVKDGVYESSITTETSKSLKTIDDGEFKGLIFPGGDYFSFFEVPDKPIFEYPIQSGQIDTFTPAINWTNTEKADSYMVQVNYNTGDTGFTGTVYTYLVPKTDEFKKEVKMKTKDTTSELETNKEIRTYQLSLKSNSCVLYRVGNVKEITNLFGVNQKVVTFSETQSLCTQVEPIKTYVYTKNDSPYVSNVGRFETPPSLENESPMAEYSLSGTVSGSTVSGATMQLIYPNLSYVTTPTDATGYFEFNDLEAGTYTLNTTYRGYAADSRVVIINSDTIINFGIKILWDNDYDSWGSKENDIIKY